MDGVVEEEGNEADKTDDKETRVNTNKKCVLESRVDFMIEVDCWPADFLSILYLYSNAVYMKQWSINFRSTFPSESAEKKLFWKEVNT